MAQSAIKFAGDAFDLDSEPLVLVTAVFSAAYDVSGIGSAGDLTEFSVLDCDCEVCVGIGVRSWLQPIWQRMRCTYLVVLESMVVILMVYI